MMIDAVGSSEGGNNGMVMVQAGQTAMKGGRRSEGRQHRRARRAGKPLAAGCGVIGKLARARDIPLEYYKDPKKTAETFVTVRRRPLRDAGRLRADRGRRPHHAPRPRLGVDQLGRREDLPGGGRDRR
jgi:hypothetical protein